MSAHNELCRPSAQKAHRCLESNLIAYASSVIHRGKVMIVLKGLEHTGGHHIAKVAVGARHIDPAGVLQPQTKMATLKGHRLALTDQPCRYAVDCTLPRRARRRDVQVDAQ